jgi:hypothetical protein
MKTELPEQSYASHRRWFPLWHMFALPILLANIVVEIVRLVRAPSLMRGWDVMVALGILGVGLVARYMALVNQNRIIQLEERIRLARILPDDLRGRISELRLRQLVGLRFASDAELPDLVRRCLDGDLQTADSIKRAVKEWRPDHLRV